MLRIGPSDSAGQLDPSPALPAPASRSSARKGGRIIFPDDPPVQNAARAAVCAAVSRLDGPVSATRQLAAERLLVAWWAAARAHNVSPADLVHLVDLPMAALEATGIVERRTRLSANVRILRERTHARTAYGLPPGRRKGPAGPGRPL